MIKLIYKTKLISKDNEKCFNRFGRPFLSKKYKQWEEYIKLLTIAQYRGSVLNGNVRVEIEVQFKDKRHIDIQNGGKSILDALQGIIFQNDRQVSEFRIKRRYGEFDAFWVIIDEIY